jgi:diguanylate cyclase (GGDEF)-like protein/PAS domain S-box-containing protein
MKASISALPRESAPLASSPDEEPQRGRQVKYLPKLSPTVLAYLMGPLALPVIILLMHFGLVVRRPIWLWIAVFIATAASSLIADLLYRHRPSPLRIHVRIAQNAAAVTAVIYLSGWGPVLGLAFVVLALENMARGGSRLWRTTVLWSLLGIAAGQTAIWERWAPSVLSVAKANTLAFLGSFLLFFVIRMAGAVMEQKELADTSLRRSEDRFRSLIQNSTDVTLVVNDEGFCTYVSPSITPMLGFQPGELIGQPTADFVHDEDRERVSARMRTDTATSSKSVSVHFRMLTKNNSFHLVEAVVADQRDRPSVSGFVVNLRDITERTKAARDLEYSQESFRVLFEQHPHPMWVYDRETLGFLEVNQCATEKYGYTREEFLSMVIMDIRPHEEARRLANFMRAERPNLDYAGIWRHRTKAGVIINMDVTTHELDFRGRRGILVMAQDVTERVRLEQQLRDHAFHDALTGLPNRSLLLDRVDQLNVQARRSNANATVICLNIDKFKLVNETYGRDIGDGLICAVGDRLVDSLREADTVGRVAADEFVILAAPPVLGANPDIVAQKILDLVGSKPFRVEGQILSVTASVGITVASAQTGGELIQNADAALKLAKAEGGNRYVVFAREMQAAVNERIQLSIDLRKATKSGQFENYYQPVVDVKSQNVIGVEALVRWRHPTLGLIPPLRFISLAEETGLIRDIGRLVLRQACEQLMRWQCEYPRLTVAVNVSVFQLRSDDFISDVRGALEWSGLRAESLVLEVTESILIDNPETALERLRALKNIGVRLAIDDFGTGYSSLSYLRLFPFDILKIDRSFIASLADSPQAVAMVRTMIQLGRQQKLEVIAEGVELEEQLDILRRLHCKNVQGHLFSRPLDADATSSFLMERSVNEDFDSVRIHPGMRELIRP